MSIKKFFSFLWGILFANLSILFPLTQAITPQTQFQPIPNLKQKIVKTKLFFNPTFFKKISNLSKTGKLKIVSVQEKVKPAGKGLYQLNRVLVVKTLNKDSVKELDKLLGVKTLPSRVTFKDIKMLKEKYLKLKKAGKIKKMSFSQFQKELKEEIGEHTIEESLVVPEKFFVNQKLLIYKDNFSFKKYSFKQTVPQFRLNSGKKKNKLGLLQLNSKPEIKSTNLTLPKKPKLPQNYLKRWTKEKTFIYGVGYGKIVEYKFKKRYKKWRVLWYEVSFEFKTGAQIFFRMPYRLTVEIPRKYFENNRKVEKINFKITPQDLNKNQYKTLISNSDFTHNGKEFYLFAGFRLKAKLVLVDATMFNDGIDKSVEKGKDFSPAFGSKIKFGKIEIPGSNFGLSYDYKLLRLEPIIVLVPYLSPKALTLKLYNFKNSKLTPTSLYFRKGKENITVNLRKIKPANWDGTERDLDGKKFNYYKLGFEAGKGVATTSVKCEVNIGIKLTADLKKFGKKVWRFAIPVYDINVYDINFGDFPATKNKLKVDELKVYGNLLK